ncbi:hypothetical protein RV18_GL000760 [Enterococcus termitis]|nr:hypothetical protein RV18_GL000760 [Enterococcus termitis]
MKEDNMKRKKVKLILILGLLLSVSGVFSSIPASASNDDWGFGFTIQANQANSRSSARYRETTKTNNQWKVNMQKSGEGGGTITRYWLEVPNGTNVSTSKNVKQGGGAYYTNAYSDASKKNVHLTAENNNYNRATYRVSGYWDEETN